MGESKSMSWPYLDPDALAAYAAAQPFEIEGAYLPGVLETLAALQAHARTVAAALEAETGS
jgi:hypothetical protein